MLRKAFIMALMAATLTLAFASASLAETWVKIPGRVVYDGDDGNITSVYFSKWASNKSRFVPTSKTYDQRKAGNFSYNYDDMTVVMPVEEAQQYDLNGDKNPIVITFRDNTKLEAQVNNSFIWAIARMKEFKFISDDPETKKEIRYSVPSESIRTIYFFADE